MNYEINLRSLLLLLAMAQAIVVSVLLLRRAMKGDLYLTGLILALATSLISYTIGFMGAYDYAREHGFDLSFFPFGNPYLYGPFILLYTMALTDRHFAWKRRYGWWFVPAIIFYLIHFSVWGATPPDLRDKLSELVLMQWYQKAEGIGYYLFTGFMLSRAFTRLRSYAALIEQEYANTGAMTLHWLRAFLYAFIGYFCIDLLFEFVSLFLKLGYTGYYWLNLTRAGLLYYISATGLNYRRKTEVEYALLQHRSQAVYAIEHLPKTAPESARTPLATSELDAQKEKLLHLFQREQPWIDPELTLSQLAEKTKLNTTQLSYLINNGLGKNFNDFVNEYRVESVKVKLKDPAFSHLSILGMAFESGFNSKATFNRAFKKITGQAPSSFID